MHRLVTISCAALTLAVSNSALAQKATPEMPASCWRYGVTSDGVGSRFGIKGTTDDRVLSRTAYYALISKKVSARSPIAATSGALFKVEYRSEAAGLEDDLELSGLFVELDNVTLDNSVRNDQFQYYTDAEGRSIYLRLVPMVARFKAGEAVVDVPFSTQGPDLLRQDLIIRLGAYTSTTWPRGPRPEFDPKASLPTVQQIDANWRKAGTMTIEILTTGDNPTVAATSDTLPYPGDKAAAEFARLNGRASEMIKGGECQHITD